MNKPRDFTEPLARVLAEHGLQNITPEIASALERRIAWAWAWAGSSQSSRALRSRERARVLSCAKALLRHQSKPPRRKEATNDRRETLICLIDSLPAIVRIAAATGCNVTPILDRLKANQYDGRDLENLIAAMQEMRPGEGAAPSKAPYLPLLRGGVLAWEYCEREERYSYSPYTGETTGPLPAFLRALVELACLAQPTDEALHTHLRALKNV